MTKLEKLEREIAALPPEDIKALAEWFDALREKLWDDALAADSMALDALASDALADFRSGSTTSLPRRQ